MIYFVQEDRETQDGMIKIGYAARDIHRRICVMQTGNPYYLRLLGTIPGGTKRDESKLHRKFKKFRVWIRARGNRRWAFRGEWFTPAPELLAFIAALPVSRPAKPLPAESILFD
jgi:hypothetical protein